ncbi:MAG: trans-sialidase, partial [Thaumarchaeota archaeon]|nr:trans-sialidase [Nitrososphaerota archaeon]
MAQLEAKLANLSSQVKPAETKPAPAPEPKPQQRPAASGPT